MPHSDPPMIQRGLPIRREMSQNKVDKNNIKQHIDEANKRKKSEESVCVPQLSIQMTIPKQPLDFSIKEEFDHIKSKEQHLPRRTIKYCFLVHGLEGTAHDLRNLRSILGYYLQDYKFYLAESNENNTTDKIENLGQRLAREIEQSVRDRFLDSDIMISIIGHSLGGLIIRAALPFLEKYKNNLMTYISIGTPHLGLSANNFVVSTGLKMLCQVRTNESIREMTLCHENEYLLKLSSKEGLNWFKNVVLIGNYDDGYVPINSAKIYIEPDLSPKDIIRMMAENLGQTLKQTNVTKMMVYTPNVTKGMDYFLGRQAHIEILENSLLKRIVFRELRSYF